MPTVSLRNQKQVKMKKKFSNLTSEVSRYLLLISMAASVFLTSCSDDEEPVVFVISEDDAAEFVAVVLSVNTYGFAANAIRFSEEVSSSLSCGAQLEDSGTISDTSVDGTITYSYNFNESYSYVCDANGGTVQYSFIADQELSTLRSDVDSDISGIWTLGNIDNAGSSYSLSGIYSRSSDRDSKTDELPSAFIITGLEFQGLAIDKSSGYLVGGTAGFELSGSQIGTAGQAFEGVINFSDPEATQVVFTDVSTYVLNLLTGEIQKF